MAAPLPHPEDPGQAPPRLVVVAPDAEESETGIGHAIARGAIAGFVGVGALVAIGSAVAGMEPASAVGFGAFVGSWGGAGFGAMLGGVVGFTRHLDAEHAP